MKPKSYSSRRTRSAFVPRSGFTLIEITVVLAIAAVVSAITLGGFRSLSENNQRTGCQANMAQIYLAMRQYATDNDGQAPPYYRDETSNKPLGIGLWALWTFPRDIDPADANPNKSLPAKPKETDTTKSQKPLAVYLRTAKLLHCPADTESDAEDGGLSHSELFTDSNNDTYNPKYVSYQNHDYTYTYEPANYGPNSLNRDGETYLPLRTIANTTTAEQNLFRRQLLQTVPDGPDADTLRDATTRPSAENTIVFWCRYHRLSRPYDNVLFGDGSIQLLPQEQDELDGACNPTGTVLTGWKRVPRRADCQ